MDQYMGRGTKKSMPLEGEWDISTLAIYCEQLMQLEIQQVKLILVRWGDRSNGRK